jgi:mono/diheme cytochrome c family protein
LKGSKLAALAALAGAGCATPALAAPDGAALFAEHCAACHQADGTGTVGLAPPRKGEHRARLGADRGYLPGVLVHGLSGAIQVGGQPFVGSMPAFGPQLDDTSLAAIATHVRATVQGASGDAPYRADDLAQARREPGGPPQMRQRRARVLGAGG